MMRIKIFKKRKRFVVVFSSIDDSNRKRYFSTGDRWSRDVEYAYRYTKKEAKRVAEIFGCETEELE